MNVRPCCHVLNDNVSDTLLSGRTMAYPSAIVLILVITPILNILFVFKCKFIQSFSLLNNASLPNIIMTHP